MTGGSGADIFYTDVTETTYYVHSGGMEYTLHAYDYEDVITDDTASDEIRDM